MDKNRGFTLIELMIVITILAILSAIALPNLMRARLQSNEASAVGNMRAICTGQISYHGAHNSYGEFADLISKNPPWIDGDWTNGYIRHGYIYDMPTATGSSFEAFAEPETIGMSGERWFFVNASGVIRWNVGSRPDENSLPIPELH